MEIIADRLPDISSKRSPIDTFEGNSARSLNTGATGLGDTKNAGRLASSQAPGVVLFYREAVEK